MQRTFKPRLAALALVLVSMLSGSAFAQEAAIRKALAERLPNLPKIDEITKSPIPGLFEVRYDGSEILYSDEKGDFILVNGAMVDTKTRTDLTQARVDKLLAIDFDKLPLKDAMVIRQGSGTRRMAVFVDPNCGYCKRFERDLAAIKDVTIYTFLMPILGPDSNVKSRDICAARSRCRPGAPGCWTAWRLPRAASATPRRSTARWPSRSNSASPARRPSSSPTAHASRARCRATRSSGCWWRPRRKPRPSKPKGRVRGRQ